MTISLIEIIPVKIWLRLNQISHYFSISFFNTLSFSIILLTSLFITINKTPNYSFLMPILLSKKCRLFFDLHLTISFIELVCVHLILSPLFHIFNTLLLRYARFNIILLWIKVEWRLRLSLWWVIILRVNCLNMSLWWLIE